MTPKEAAEKYAEAWLKKEGLEPIKAKAAFRRVKEIYLAGAKWAFEDALGKIEGLEMARAKSGEEGVWNEALACAHGNIRKRMSEGDE